ncbi:MAG: 3,4-dihydroxy-9,10-secoandrosta-1,3,5(10)-triene-9,17-dione 4,5-dioxygenase [Halieaceae bacterium]|jgi:3,4-dihydroxy-9,10-secoandrosta-1,3,5(10)-triene-9,17-dione 4,5-dioxygenase
MGIASIGYLRIQSTDTSAWMDFATNILGLMATDRADDRGAQFLRMDDHPFRFMIEPGDTDRLTATGLEFRDWDEWKFTCDTLTAAGHTVEEGSARECERRCVIGLAMVTDPSGNLLELYHGRKLDYLPLNSPVGIKEFITGDEFSGDLGFGHAVLPAPATEETIAFYTELMGLYVSDDLYPPMPDGAPEARVYFMHADNPRQHSLALYNHPHPSGLVHMMIEVGSLDEVGRALDRVKAAGLSLQATLGRHVNDNMCSFYVQAPGGITVEYGCDGLLVDWENYTPTVSVVGDLWGHEYHFAG